VHSLVGDEPGLKEMIGFRSGGCTFFCHNCTFRNQNGLYDPAIHKPRNYEKIKKMCIKAERCLARKTQSDEVNDLSDYDAEEKKERENKDTKAYKELSEQGVFPMENVFHTAPMGVK
jgi:hypothetical protein